MWHLQIEFLDFEATYWEIEREKKIVLFFYSFKPVSANSNEF